jgi:aminoglycoside phosphotransferase (APT) family kinase protein
MERGVETTAVRAGHGFDEAALAAYLVEHVPGFGRGLSVRQFEGGQSNPSFLLEASGRRYVLRKQPPGKLLPSAHRVDREYRVMTALADSEVPVPRTFCLCEDPSVIGTSFFVMEFVPGRILRDSTLPDCAPGERRAVFEAMLDVLARLHAVSPEAVGLLDFGRPGNYFARQVSRWSRQYELSKSSEIGAMDALCVWLPKHVPEDDETTLVHGDYRLGNMILDADEARLVALLDWELSTLGHPLADLAYNCVFDVIGVGADAEASPAPTGIPPESEYLAGYARRTGREPGPHWNFCLAFALFRLAAITQGVYARALQGNAASGSAASRGDHVERLAERAWAIASRSSVDP